MYHYYFHNTLITGSLLYFLAPISSMCSMCLILLVSRTLGSLIHLLISWLQLAHSCHHRLRPSLQRLLTLHSFPLPHAISHSLSPCPKIIHSSICTVKSYWPLVRSMFRPWPYCTSWLQSSMSSPLISNLGFPGYLNHSLYFLHAVASQSITGRGFRLKSKRKPLFIIM